MKSEDHIKPQTFFAYIRTIRLMDLPVWTYVGTWVVAGLCLVAFFCNAFVLFAYWNTGGWNLFINGVLVFWMGYLFVRNCKQIEGMRRDVRRLVVLLHQKLEAEEAAAEKNKA